MVTNSFDLSCFVIYDDGVYIRIPGGCKKVGGNKALLDISRG